ncbi:MAG: chromate efflux transporter [Planctomycetes bacterium]|nr:chromate efflux transporter [Planctomycetota bacterium]
MSAGPTFGEAFRFWLQLGFISFGGPTGQIAIMHRELVERKKWISESRFLDALNYCMLLPGPEAQQLATYSGWLLHGAKGGIVAGAFFVLPSVVILWALSWLYAAQGEVPWVAAAFAGLQPAVLAIVLSATIRIGRKALRNAALWAVAALAFAALHFAHAPFPAVILGAGVLGLAGGRLAPSKFAAGKGRANGAGKEANEPSPPARPSWRRASIVAVLCLSLWWAPVAAVGLWRGTDDILFQEGIFFSKAAVVTFGGAYAVLPYVAQRAVEDHGWLDRGEMMDGLGMAETTPGPLIMVLAFVGFMGGWHDSGGLPPLLAATLGLVLTTWVTFLPSFLFIFLGAPLIEKWRGVARLTATLTAITAAVVGVIANLAIWFGRHVLFPESGGVNLFAVVVAVVAFVGMERWKWDVVPVVLGSALAGVALRTLSG